VQYGWEFVAPRVRQFDAATVFDAVGVASVACLFYSVFLFLRSYFISPPK
jgi:hypothetical protein